MLKTRCIYRLKKTDAKKYRIINEEHFNIYFDASTVAYFMLSSIKKKKLKNGTEYTYVWLYQIFPEMWTEAIEHDVKEQNKDLYESLWHTYDGIEGKASFNAMKHFLKMQSETQSIFESSVPKVKEN